MAKSQLRKSANKLVDLLRNLKKVSDRAGYNHAYAKATRQAVYAVATAVDNSSGGMVVVDISDNMVNVAPQDEIPQDVVLIDEYVTPIYETESIEVAGTIYESGASDNE